MYIYSNKKIDVDVVATFVIMLPFLQLGVNYYISVQMFMFLFLVVHLSFSDFVKNIGKTVILLILMVVPLFFYKNNEQLHMILWGLRQFLCVSVLIAVLSHARPIKISKYYNFENAIIGLLVFLLIVIIIQYVGLKFDSALNIPSKFFVSNQNTVVGFENAIKLGLYSQVRPSVFFGEPSYLSFICFSLVFIGYVSFKSGLKIMILTVLAIATVILANSLSGILAVTTLLYVRIVRNRKMHEKIIFTLVCILASIVSIVLFSQSVFSQRILGILGIGRDIDISSNIRLFSPFLILSDIFSNYPFGLPKDLLVQYIQNNFNPGFSGTDNGFLNIFINYGYMGFIIIGVIFYQLRTNMLLVVYILLSSMFNGSFFSYDKVAVIGLAVLISRSYKSYLIIKADQMLTNPDFWPDISRLAR